MTPEIKTRLAQIQRGEVPEGYKEIGTSIIPNNWTKAPFSKIGTISSGLVDPQKPPYSTMQHIGPENIEKDTGRILETKTACELGLISGKFYFDADSIVYSKIRPNLNKACAPDFEGICSADCYSIKPKDNIDKRFLLGLMLSNSFYRRAVACSMRTGMPKINQDDLNLIPLCFPQSIGEQKKVAEILGVLDRVVTLKEQLIAEKRRQKQYLMQQFLTGRQQPPGFNGEWKRIKLGSVLKERKEKNNRQDLRICSVSVHRGVVDQIEYLGRSYAASDTSKYNVVCYGDIIYTKSPTGDFPLGIIDMLKPPAMPGRTE